MAFTLPEIFAALKPGANLLIDDGKVRLLAERVSESRIDAQIIQGGMVKNNKGVNLPDTLLPIPALTPKDRSDLDYAIGVGLRMLTLRHMVSEREGLYFAVSAQRPLLEYYANAIAPLVDALAA